MNDAEFTRAVKRVLTQAYDAYLKGLKRDQAPSSEEIVEITNGALADIFKSIDALPLASRFRAAKLALAISVRVAFQVFDAGQRAEIEAAKRRRFSDN
jgi:hypothetical protein